MKCLFKVLQKKYTSHSENVEFKVKSDGATLNPKIAELCKAEPKIEKCADEK